MHKLIAINKKRIYRIISIIGLFFAMVMLLWCTLKMRKILDDDMSAELILGNLLAKENKLFMTKSWLYSTQLRVLDIQFIYNILFRFINNWTHVHIITILIMKLGISLLIYLLCKEIKLKQLTPLVLIAYFLPGCFDKIQFFYIGLYYEVYLVYTLTILLLFAKYIHNNSRMIFIIACILTFVFCLEGIRIIVIIYVPLVISAFILCILNKNRDYKLIKTAITMAICGGLGYLVNRYFFSVYSGTIIDASNTSFVFDVKKIISFFDHVIYSIGGKHFFLGLLLFILSIVLSIKTIFLNKNNCISFFTIFYICLLFMIFISCSFTDTNMQIRYVLQASIYTTSIIVICLFTSFNETHYLSIIAVIFVLLYISLSPYSMFNKRDNSTELEYISSYLVENEYYQGYSTYWSSDIVTELSNGSIEVWIWGGETTLENSFTDIYRTHPSMQLKNHFTTHPEGKIFILLNNYMNSTLLDLIWYFTEDDIILRTDSFIVYGFDSFNDLKKIMKIN